MGVQGGADCLYTSDMNENDKILIVKYITRQASEEEIAMVKYLISSREEYESFYVQYYEAWQKALQYNPETIDAEKAYNTFLAGSAGKEQVRRPVYRLWKWRAAAAVLLISAAAALFYLQYSPGVPTPGKEIPGTLALTEINVPRGTTKQLTLSDGTRIRINAGSYLRFDESFGKTSRTVYLDGEAYFDIADNKLPFIVKTDYYTIRDIGTIFNVKAYSADFALETAVIEGEISVEGKLFGNSDKAETVSIKKQQALKLNYAPQDAAVLQESRSEQNIDIIKVQKMVTPQLEEYTGWTEDLLVFEGKTFQEISKIMERKYDVEIIMDDMKLRNYEYTGSFRNVDNVEKALQILKETTDIQYTKNGRVIKIYGTEFK